MFWKVFLPVSLLAGLIHGITGFGAGIVVMIALTQFYPVREGAGMSALILLGMIVLMVIRYRKEIRVRQAVLPAVPYVLCSALAIRLSGAIDAGIMKRALGAFLLVLSVYELFIAGKGEKREIGTAGSFAIVAVAGVFEGLFSIGGPLMVIYFLQRTEDTREYLGTLQFFFLIITVCNTALRVAEGILRPEHFPVIALCCAGVAAGSLIGGLVVDRLDQKVLRRITYAAIGLAGLYYLIA
ncbi:MAG: sulfite exporter TauE/SafE family protein [Lachnospiraceae bacterium]|nr:sulfite exporter TauE/SafE family protein [Lachnospiraceae bacterium]